MQRAKIVVGLGWGDEGKGITTDFLASSYPDAIVVRYNGGHQAGHNVVIGDKSHIHSSYGAGTLRGLPSYLTEHCCFYPPNMHREYDVLVSKGIKPILYIHPLAKLTTPYDVAYNRVIEKRLGHGSVGIGIGATFSRNTGTYKLHALDILHNILYEKMQAISAYYNTKTLDFTQEERNDYDNIVSSETRFFYNAISFLRFRIKPYDFLKSYSTLIFEGAQGIMLDMDFGVFPNVTYSHTTSKNAIEVCNKLGIKDVQIYYVTRCYQTRHGNGWMSQTTPIELVNNEKETNVTNEWQGNFRTSELDYSLLRYAMMCDESYSDNLLKHLVVTCLDHRPSFKIKDSLLPTNICDIISSYSPDCKDFKFNINPFYSEL